MFLEEKLGIKRRIAYLERGYLRFKIRRFFGFYVPLGLFVLFFLFLGYFGYLIMGQDLGAIEELPLAQPLQVYDQSGAILGQFGEARREYVPYDKIPKELVLAFVAAEDDHFFTHSGIDIPALFRGAFEWVRYGHIRSGGSTITMQLARNYYLTREKTLSRKFTEIAIALRLEQRLSKPKIMELYLNKIYLGNHAYGIAAAAKVYYNKGLYQLSVSEMASLASLPKAPSNVNPLDNPERSLERRNWILSRMHSLGYLSEPDYQRAVKTPNTAVASDVAPGLNAGYISEMARLALLSKPQKYLGRNSITPDELYNGGFRVETTINARLQKVAAKAVVNRIVLEERKLAYRGIERHLQGLSGSFQKDQPLITEALLPSDRAAQDEHELYPAAVIGSDAEGLTVVRAASQAPIFLPWKDNLFAGMAQTDTGGFRYVAPQARFAYGDVVRIYKVLGKWVLTQMPLLQGALISVDANSGAILSMIGGFDYGQSQFNRTTQSLRQVGSIIKPLLYTDFLVQGGTAASILSDYPIIDSGAVYKEDKNDIWHPSNDSDDYLGEISAREALYRSRNMPSIRLIQQLGLGNVHQFFDQIGAPPTLKVNDTTMALGSGVAAPIDIAGLYAMFANGGYRKEVYLISRVRDRLGRVLYERNQEPQGERLIPPGVHFIINSMLRDVTKRGTAYEASALGRDDMGGKTGTTQTGKDVWFAGFVTGLTTVVWLGYDNEKASNASFGATVALPTWMDYMREADKLYPESLFPVPPGVISVRIHKRTFKQTDLSDPDGYDEYFIQGTEPQELYVRPGTSTPEASKRSTDLF